MATKNYTEATPEDIKNWENTDYFRKGDFSVMKLFVAIPTLIQISALLAMFAIFYLNTLIF